MKSSIVNFSSVAARQVLICTAIICLCIFSATAQKRVHTDYSNKSLAGVLLAKNVPDKPGQSVTVLDTISDYRMSADTAIFYLGNGTQDSRVAVLIPHFDKIYKKQIAGRWVGKPFFVRGTVSDYNMRPAVIVKDHTQAQIINKVKVKHSGSNQIPKV